MPHTIKCPNCKGPIHLAPGHDSAVCEYCGHQARQTVLARPSPPPPQRPALPQAPVAVQRSSRTLLLVILALSGFPLLLGVIIPVFVCSVQRTSKLEHAQKRLGVSALDSDPDQKLALALGAQSQCINDFTAAVSSAKERYLGWVHRDAGPDCRSSCVSYGVHKTYYNVDGCKKALQQAAGVMPALDRLGQSLLSAAVKLEGLTARAHKYYSQKDYLDDDCAQARALHRPLLQAFDDYDRAEQAIRVAVEEKLPALLSRRMQSARRQDDPMGAMMASYWQQGIAVRDLVVACARSHAGQRSDGDTTALRALITKVDRTSEATVAAEKRVQPMKNNWSGYFLFPYTYENHLHSAAERLVKAAKEHVRCASGQQQCSRNTLNPVIEAYNRYVGYAKGIGPQLRKLNESDHSHCFR